MNPPFFIKGKHILYLVDLILISRLFLFSFVDEAHHSVFIVDDDCSTLSHQTTSSNESTYLNPNQVNRYRSTSYYDGDEFPSSSSNGRRMSTSKQKKKRNKTFLIHF